MSYVDEGTLTTDKRTVDESTEWDTTEEWEEYQEIDGVKIENGVLKLEENLIPDSAIHRLQLDEDSDNFEDSIGDQDATNQGTDRVTNDWQGGAARENTGSDYIEWTDLSDFGSQVSQSHSLAFTFETTQTDDDMIHFLGVRDDGDGNTYFVRFNDSGDGELDMWMATGGVTDRFVIESEGGWNDGDKHRVVFVVEDSTNADGTVYIDNSDELSTISESDSISLSDFTDPLSIFVYNRNDGTGDGYFDGVLDDVVIYDEPLTSTEVEGDYNEQPWT